MASGPPREKILLPYDGSPSARLALRLAAGLAKAGQAPESLTLLRVTGGGYLARHIQNVDLRVKRLDQTEEWQRLRQRYQDDEIRPLLAAAQAVLVEEGFPAPVDLKIVDGKIGQKILEVAQEGQYSTILMGRRGLSKVKELIVGSTTEYVLSRAAGLTLFLAGPEQTMPETGPLFPLLVPVDGSEASLGAVRQAALLARAGRDQKPDITLLHVVDLALMGLTLAEETDLILDEGREALAAARRIMEQAGVHEGVAERLVSGVPAQVIAQEAAARQAALIVMGSVGHSALARLFIGSVTHSILHLVTQATLAVVYPEDTHPQ